MDRNSELELWRRSLAMAPPGSPALDREEAMRLIVELQQLALRLGRLRRRIETALSEDEDPR